MDVAIMQPYLFPYIGYFQLMAAADVFVVYDDVQYIKGGWINRNRIRVEGRPSLITLPVHADAYVLDINRRRYADDPGAVRQWLRRLESAYRRAPRYAEVSALVAGALAFEDRNVAAFNTNALRAVADAIGIEVEIRVSSEMAVGEGLRGAERVIAMCCALGAKRYINPPGGRALYDPARFHEAGLELAFLQPRPHLSSLSIIDVLMHHEPAAVREMLQDFELEVA